VVIGTGCLMYGVLLKYAGREHLRMLDNAHRYVLDVLVSALKPLIREAMHVGTSDLAIADRKFSGNSLRCKRDHLLYHGTVLYDFDLTLIDRLLAMPPREPDYRAGRSHPDFITNAGASAVEIRQAIQNGFHAAESLVDWPRLRMQQLVATRYSSDAWNLKR